MKERISMKFVKSVFRQVLPLMLVVVMGFASCRPKDKNENTPTVTDSFSQLVASELFDWSSTREIAFYIGGVQNEVVMIADQYDENIFHKALSHQATYNITLSIPSYLDTISINKQSMPVSDAIFYTVPKSTGGSRSDIAFGAEYEFKNKKVQYIDSEYLSDSKFVVAFQDYKEGKKGAAVIGTYSGDVISFGNASTFNGGNTEDVSLCKLDDNTVVVAYRDKGDSDNGYAVIGTISGTSISWSNEFVFDAGKVDYVNVVAIDATTIVVTYQDDTDSDIGKGVVGIISGGAISFGSPSVFYNSKSDHIKTTALSGGYFVTVIQDEDNNDQGTAISGLVSGNSISWGNPAVFATGKTDDPAIGALEGNDFIIAIRDEANNHNGTAFFGNADNNVLSFGNSSVFNLQKTYYISIAGINASDFVIAYTDHYNSRKGTIIEGSVSGTSLSWDTEIVFNAKTKWSSVCVDDANDIIVAFQDDSDSDKGKAIKTDMVVDSDGDGVPDHQDDYPNDPTRAFANSYPSEGYGTLAFEDLWPSVGDYDFNDLVLSYRFESDADASNYVSEITATFIVRATGAGFTNGFGFNLPNAQVSKSDINVSGYNTPVTGVTSLDANGCESGQTHITIIPYSEVPYLGNTQIGGFTKPYDTCVVTITVTTGNYSFSDFAFDSFNPFLIIDGERGRELHLPSPGYPPTDLINTAFFGTGNDDSQPASGKYYKTENNLPWALHFPVVFRYPIEKTDITDGYLKLTDWVLSGGSSYPDWYLDSTGYRDNDKLYPILNK